MKQVLVSADDAFAAMRRGKTVFYIYRGEVVYMEPKRTLIDSDIYEKAFWFVEKPETFTVDNMKRVWYSVYSLVKTLINIFGRKAK